MELALCLSGGGYRAAMFHLGVLSYLEHVNMPNGGKLLDRVHTLTCISGGGLPGLVYVLNEADGINREQGFRLLYSQLVNNNIAQLLTEKYEKAAPKGISLIRVLSEIYDDVFFHGAKFSKVLDYIGQSEMHHLSVDATDFDLGIPFRFQATRLLKIDGREEPYGVIGNKRHKIKREVASELMVSDVMAATSCFPLAFEPFTLPDEFHFENPDEIKQHFPESYVLMDGGLVDNQGIDPALHAEEHLEAFDKNHTLVILSDAGGVQDGEEDDPLKWSRHSPDFWFWIVYFTAWLAGLGFLSFFETHYYFWAGFLASVFLISVALLCVIRSFEGYVIKKIGKKLNVPGNYEFIWKSTVNNIIAFIKSRVGTAYKMVDVIMMGHIKKTTLKGLFKNDDWRNRVMLNSLPFLGSLGKWSKQLKKRQNSDPEMTPLRRVRQNTDMASSMKTTLWFSESEIKSDIPIAILACGQYSICWNLLQQIDRLNRAANATDEKERIVLTEDQKELVGLESILKGDWKRFNKNPRFLANSYKVVRK